MDIVEKIAEAKIREAQQRGDFRDLPGAGKPLVLDDNSMVPPELRAAFRILKNAGFIPAEVGIRKDIASLQGLIMRTEDDAEARRLARRLSTLLMQLEVRSGISLRNEDAYYRKIVDSVTRRNGVS